MKKYVMAFILLATQAALAQVTSEKFAASDDSDFLTFQVNRAADHSIALPQDDGKAYQFSYDMRAGATKTENFVIANTGSEDFKLGGIETWYNDNVTAKTDCPAILPMGHSCKLSLSFTPRIVGIASGQGADFSEAKFYFDFDANTY
jgi:hypothetical protein